MGKLEYVKNLEQVDGKYVYNESVAVQRWRTLGLTQGLNEDEEYVFSTISEQVAVDILNEEDWFNGWPDFETLIFPILYKCVKKNKNITYCQIKECFTSLCFDGIFCNLMSDAITDRIKKTNDN